MRRHPATSIHHCCRCIDDATRKTLIQMHPIGRLGLPEKVVIASLFLLSDESSFVTGANWVVDGGFTAGKS